MNSENVTTLGQLGTKLDSTAKTYPVLVGDNLGYRTLKFSMPINQFINISGVGNRKNIDETEAFQGQFHAQRNLIREHAIGLAKYTLMGLVRSEIRERQKRNRGVSDDILSIRKGLGDPAYTSLQPLVCNIRNCEPGGDDLEVVSAGDTNNSMYYVSLTLNHILWVVDGQHRREGFDIVLNFLNKVRNTYKYPKKGLYEPAGYSSEMITDTVHDFWMSVYEIAISRCQVAIECHLGLKEFEEQQLFFDLNSKGRKVVQSLAFQFDHTDPINSFVTKELIENEVLRFEPSDKDQPDWRKDDGRLARKDINNVTSLLCLGKTSSKNSTPALVENRMQFMLRFWEAINNIDNFGTEGAKTKTLAAQPVVLKALAKLANDLVYGHQNIRDEDGYGTLLESIKSGKLNFSHDNEIWRALVMSYDERKVAFPGIEDYLHIPEDINLDAGIFDFNNNWMRFGNRHNDIFPRLGDVIRWQIKLNPRPSVTKARELELQNG